MHAIEREHGLCVERMLRPQCAVLIEGGDAIVGRVSTAETNCASGRRESVAAVGLGEKGREAPG